MATILNEKDFYRGRMSGRELRMSDDMFDRISFGLSNDRVQIYYEPYFCSEGVRAQFFSAPGVMINEVGLRAHNNIIYQRWVRLLKFRSRLNMLLAAMNEELNTLPDLLLTPDGKMYRYGCVQVDANLAPGWGDPMMTPMTTPTDCPTCPVVPIGADHS